MLPTIFLLEEKHKTYKTYQDCMTLIFSCEEAALEVRPCVRVSVPVLSRIVKFEQIPNTEYIRILKMPRILNTEYILFLKNERIRIPNSTIRTQLFE